MLAGDEALKEADTHHSQTLNQKGNPLPIFCTVTFLVSFHKNELGETWVKRGAKIKWGKLLWKAGERPQPWSMMLDWACLSVPRVLRELQKNKVRWVVWMLEIHAVSKDRNKGSKRGLPDGLRFYPEPFASEKKQRTFLWTLRTFCIRVLQGLLKI